MAAFETFYAGDDARAELMRFPELDEVARLLSHGMPGGATFALKRGIEAWGNRCDLLADAHLRQLADSLDSTPFSRFKVPPTVNPKKLMDAVRNILRKVFSYCKNEEGPGPGAPQHRIYQGQSRFFIRCLAIDDGESKDAPGPHDACTTWSLRLEIVYPAKCLEIIQKSDSRRSSAFGAAAAEQKQ